MERFYAHIRARDAALQQAPEILQSVGVYTTIHILNRVIYNLVCIVGRQSFIREQCIGIERRSSSNVFAYFILQYFLAATGHDASTNLAAAFEDTHHGGLVLRSRTG